MARKFRLLCCILAATAPASARADFFLFLKQTPTRAADFQNSIGVNTHFRMATGPYTIAANMYSLLQYIGVSHVRDNASMVAPTAAGYQTVQYLASNGIKFDFIVMQPPQGLMAGLQALGPYLDFIEGPNEVNLVPVNYAGLSGAAGAIAEQQAIYRLVKSSPSLKTVPVLNFSVSQGHSFAPYGNMSAYADYTNVHDYMSQGVSPYFGMPQVILKVTDTPGRPPVITETSYNTYLTSETAQAKYDLDWLCDNAMHGYVARSYLYQLSDGVADPTGNTAEDHWGLFRIDNSPKLAAVALHNLAAILADPAPSAGSFVPRLTSYALQPSLVPPPQGRSIKSWHTVIQKSDGTNDLMVWSEPLIWNNLAGKDIKNLPGNLVTVWLDKTYKVIKFYDPLKSSKPIYTYYNLRAVAINVVDHPLIIEYSEP